MKTAPLGSSERWLLMSGMHGGLSLFEPLQISAQAAGAELVPLAYPQTDAESASTRPEAIFDGLDDAAAARHGSFVFAESFSGPLAVQWMTERQPDVAGLVLCASFLRWPSLAPLAPLGDGAVRVLPSAR